ncbi:MAG: phosphodiester glycosidase family protein [Fimbriimonadaceae bacterium]
MKTRQPQTKLGTGARIGIASTCCLLLSSSAIAQDSTNYAYYKFKHGNANFHAVQVDMNREGVRMTAHYNSALTRMWDTIGEKQPVAAITGTFFAFENQQPVADVIVDGQQVAWGQRGSVLCVDWYGKVSIQNAPKFEEFNYLKYRYALRGMIKVVDHGEVAPNPRAQGFRDAGIWGNARRTGLGITDQNKLVMVATDSSITLSELGRALKSRGCNEAVAMDGGGSSLLYYMGSVKVSPYRPLSTLFLVEKGDPLDQTFRDYVQRTRDTQNMGMTRGIADGFRYGR